MFKYFLKIGIAIIIGLPAYYFCASSSINAMGHVSDQLSSSWPGTGANHTIKFQASEDIPPSGKITITPEADDFFIMGDFDHTDVDLSTSSAADGIFVDRNLAASSSAVADGIAVVSSTTAGVITVTMNSSYGISAGEWVKAELGTHASYGEAGDRQVINPPATGVFKVFLEAFDAGDNFLDRGHTYVVTIEPVSLSVAQPKIRSNGTPSGYLQYGTTQTLMSLTTNYAASCRYALVPDTLYQNMTQDFSYTGVYYHSTLLTGLANGSSYTYYVRCRDSYSVDDATDYVISFQVSGQENAEEGEESGTPGGGGGGSGGGGGGGIGQDRGRGIGNFLPYPPPPGMPGVVFKGWAYPLSIVYVLKDGRETGKVAANTKAEFGAFLADLPQGVYTFGIWSQDSEGRRSITNSTTFYIAEGTQTTVSDIFLPPTIALGDNSIQAGESFEVFGQSVPGGTVEVWLYPDKEKTADSETVKKEGLADDAGKWRIFINSAGMAGGNCALKAKAVKDKVGTSGFSEILKCSISGETVAEECAGADLNKDGRVNLTDFSILLYFWGTDNACADQNHDGTVNLTDFSIMMFYWTG